MKITKSLFDSCGPSASDKHRSIATMGLCVLLFTVLAALSSCNNNPNDPDSSSSIGDTLALSGAVYTESTQGNYQRFTGDLSLGTAGKIEYGDLQFSFGRPSLTNAPFLNAEEPMVVRWFSGWDDLSFSKSNVKTFIFHAWFAYEDPGEQRYVVSKRNSVYGVSGNIATWVFENVIFVYVEGDITISGKGKTNSSMGTSPNNFTVTSEDFSLALKKGWNTIYIERKWEQTPSTSLFNIRTDTVSLDNPALKWVLDEYEE